jgi:hypothetical protein
MGRVSDRYDSVELPYIDSKVASALCIGGACTYVLNENIVLQQLVLQCLVPGINEQFGPQVVLVLGTALLWCIFNESISHIVPVFIQDRVHAVIATPEGFRSPVERRLVVATGDNDNVSLSQVSTEKATVKLETCSLNSDSSEQSPDYFEAYCKTHCWCDNSSRGIANGEQPSWRPKGYTQCQPKNIVSGVG